MLGACSISARGRKRRRRKAHRHQLIPNATPKSEPITNAGNKSPYEVFGKTYWVLPTSKGYKETGIASWYGTKFHGRLTSNGEVYNMYGMTAAHKSLPIPSYARVTNIENGSLWWSELMTAGLSWCALNRSLLCGGDEAGLCRQRYSQGID